MSRRRASKWRVYKCEREHQFHELLKPHIVVECDGYPADIFTSFAEAWEYLRAKASEPA